jgi:multimeric flavodoxin WrbA
MVAQEIKRVLESKGHQVSVHHIDEVKAKDVPPAELYIFGSPTRFGGPIGGMKRFLKKAALPPGSRYAVFATHGAAAPDKKTGRVPTDEEMARLRRTIPIMDAILAEKGLAKVAEQRFLVTGDQMKGRLTEGWQDLAERFATAVIT